jgi:lipopolysaccharide transport system ATP-binding protein
VELIPQRTSPDEPVDIRTAFVFRVEMINEYEDAELNIGLHLFSYSGDCIFDVSSPARIFKKGVIEGVCSIPGNFLNDGAYYLSVIIVKDTSVPVYYLEECISFEVADYRENMKWYGKWMGAVRPLFPFTLEQKHFI